jgi:thymidylate synthase (FAD)
MNESKNFVALPASFEILTPISEGAKEELQHIEKIGRECYQSMNSFKEDGSSAEAFIKNLIKHGHESVIEHSTLSVRFYVDRGVTHEIVRHRLASFTQESTRYCNYSAEKFGNTIKVADILHGMQVEKKLDSAQMDKVYEIWETAMRNAATSYFEMLDAGATPQIARSVLPNSTLASLTMTANYREWRHFFKLRADKAAHPQLREVAIPLLKVLQDLIPVIFDDIEV